MTELDKWLKIKLDCEESITKHGSIIELMTDRGQLTIRANPAVPMLAQALRVIDKLKKEMSNDITLEL
jgi:hypothetical protein